MAASSTRRSSPPSAVRASLSLLMRPSRSTPIAAPIRSCNRACHTSRPLVAVATCASASSSDFLAASAASSRASRSPRGASTTSRSAVILAVRTSSSWPAASTATSSAAASWTGAPSVCILARSRRLTSWARIVASVSRFESRSVIFLKRACCAPAPRAFADDSIVARSPSPTRRSSSKMRDANCGRSSPGFASAVRLVSMSWASRSNASARAFRSLSTRYASSSASKSPTCTAANKSFVAVRHSSFRRSALARSSARPPRTSTPVPSASVT